MVKHGIFLTIRYVPCGMFQLLDRIHVQGFQSLDLVVISMLRDRFPTIRSGHWIFTTWLDFNIWICAMWHDSSPRMWTLYLFHVVCYRPLNLSIASAHGKILDLIYGHQICATWQDTIPHIYTTWKYTSPLICAMWKSSSPQVWPWDMCHVAFYHPSDLCHVACYQPSNMVVGFVPCGILPTLGFGYRIFIMWQDTNP